MTKRGSELHRLAKSCTTYGGHSETLRSVLSVGYMRGSIGEEVSLYSKQGIFYSLETA